MTAPYSALVQFRKVGLLVLLLLCSSRLHGADQGFPVVNWERDTNALPRATVQELDSYLHTLDTTALVVVQHGRIIYQYGDIARPSYLASARKSVLSMLYGPYVANGKLNLDATLKDLHLSDVGGLLPGEKRAKLVDLITARSGVYHPAANAGDLLFMAPKRGSKEPGTWWLYNNWDFNAAGAAFEQVTGTNIYDAVRDHLALPLRMQDFDRRRQQKSGDNARSRYPAFHMWLSARDMARLGLLMLHQGQWGDQQLIPAEWVHRSTTVRTPSRDLRPWELRAGRLGYGYMWWVWDGPATAGPYRGAYTALGAYGQYLTVLPALDMVVVHKTWPTGNVGLRAYFRLLGLITREAPASAAEQAFWNHLPRLSRVWRRFASGPYYFLDIVGIYPKTACGAAAVIIAVALLLILKLGYRKFLKFAALAGCGLILLLVIGLWILTPAKAPAIPKSRMAIKVNPKTLDSYAGRYSVKYPRPYTLTLKREGDALLAEAGTGFPEELFAESDAVFFNNGESTELRFVRNEEGEIAGVTLTAKGKTHLAEKFR